MVWSLHKSDIHGTSRLIRPCHSKRNRLKDWLHNSARRYYLLDISIIHSGDRALRSAELDLFDFYNLILTRGTTNEWHCNRQVFAIRVLLLHSNCALYFPQHPVLVYPIYNLVNHRKFTIST